MPAIFGARSGRGGDEAALAPLAPKIAGIHPGIEAAEILSPRGRVAQDEEDRGHQHSTHGGPETQKAAPPVRGRRLPAFSRIAAARRPRHRSIFDVNARSFATLLALDDAEGDLLTF